MYIKNEKKLKLHELIAGKVLICKKDINCKDGVFCKGSLVYPDFVYLMDSDPKIEKLYDLSQYHFERGNVFDCKNDYISEIIDADNYTDYFAISEEASVYLKDADKEKEFSFNKSYIVREIAETCLLGAVLCPFLSLFIRRFICVNGEGDIWGIALGGLGILLFALTFVFYRIGTYIENRANGTFSQRMEYLSLIASENEYYANCDSETKRIRAKLMALAATTELPTLTNVKKKEDAI